MQIDRTPNVFIFQQLSESFQSRFWKKVIKTDCCWNWSAATDPYGYGIITVGKRGDGHIVAHRASWILEHKEIPKGMNVLHRCDNPKCVRPDHLFLGTQRDNLIDMYVKGRGGKRNRKVTDEQIRYIRALYASGFCYKKISRILGFCDVTIAGIVNREFKYCQ